MDLEGFAEKMACYRNSNRFVDLYSCGRHSNNYGHGHLEFVMDDAEYLASEKEVIYRFFALINHDHCRFIIYH